MKAIRRTFKALLLAELILLLVAAVPTLALGMILAAHECSLTWALIIPALFALPTPLVAFGEGRDERGNGGALYGHLARADEAAEAEMRKLLAEHGS